MKVLEPIHFSLELYIIEMIRRALVPAGFLLPSPPEGPGPAAPAPPSPASRDGPHSTADAPEAVDGAARDTSRTSSLRALRIIATASFACAYGSPMILSIRSPTCSLGTASSAGFSGWSVNWRISRRPPTTARSMPKPPEPFAIVVVSSTLAGPGCCAGAGPLPAGAAGAARSGTLAGSAAPSLACRSVGGAADPLLNGTCSCSCSPLAVSSSWPTRSESSVRK